MLPVAGRARPVDHVARIVRHGDRGVRAQKNGLGVVAQLVAIPVFLLIGRALGATPNDIDAGLVVGEFGVGGRKGGGKRQGRESELEFSDHGNLILTSGVPPPG